MGGFAWLSLAALLVSTQSFAPHRLKNFHRRHDGKFLRSRAPSRGSVADDETEVDVIVVGSGLGGLCCAATVASYGYSCLVLEAHSLPGGSAHGFKQRAKGVQGDFHFDTGPSFFSGLSSDGGGGTNPLKDLLDVLGESVPCHVYDSFGLLLPEGDFRHTPAFAAEVLAKVGGEEEARAWAKLSAKMGPLAQAVEALPAAALRTDAGVALTTARYLPGFARTFAAGPEAPKPWALGGTLTSDFGSLCDASGLGGSTFGRNWLDLLCFCLSGLPADGTITAELAMMFSEFYKPGATMDYPLGGAKSLVEVLVKALEERGGKVRCGARVKRLVRVNDVLGLGKVVGVELVNSSGADGTRQVIKARRGVVSNAGTWGTQKLLEASESDWKCRPAKEKAWRAAQSATPACDSFMHLHLGFRTEGLSEETLKGLQCHYMVLEDWARGVDAEENAVLISIPSVADPSLAPEGHMTLHAYTPATERFERWEHLDPKSPEYARLKEERSQVLWRAVEKVIPDIRERAVVEKVGTPLTHRRFLNRHRGSYGPAIRAPGASFPPPSTPIPGLVLCGDATFPGIGVPAVAASGIIAANAALGLECLPKHLGLLDRLGAAQEKKAAGKAAA